MEVKQLLGAITGMILKIALAVVIIVLIFNMAVAAYDFGFQVFADIPVSEGEGRTVSVVISDHQSAADVADLLEEKGLIRDARLFRIQEKLSDNESGFQAGTYELNTAMTIETMIEILTSKEATEVAN